MLFLIANTNTRPFFHHRKLGCFDHDRSQYEARGTLDDTGRRLAQDLFAAMTTIRTFEQSIRGSQPRSLKVWLPLSSIVSLH